MSEPTLAQRVHTAYSEYRRILYDELEPAIEAIVGEDRLDDVHVEFDSQYDNSVEVVLADGERLTHDERAKILALGFSIVWNDERSVRSEARLIAAERSACISAICELCRQGDPLKEQDGKWQHVYEDDFPRECKAGPLHRRGKGAV